jgi:hypothetical protein
LYLGVSLPSAGGGVGAAGVVIKAAIEAFFTGGFLAAAFFGVFGAAFLAGTFLTAVLGG